MDSSQTGDSADAPAWVWNERVLEEATPEGGVAMFYDASRDGFGFYCDRWPSPAELRAVAARYSLIHGCRRPAAEEMPERFIRLGPLAGAGERVYPNPRTEERRLEQIHRKEESIRTFYKNVMHRLDDDGLGASLLLFSNPFGAMPHETLLDADARHAYILADVRSRDFPDLTLEGLLAILFGPGGAPEPFDDDG